MLVEDPNIIRAVHSIIRKHVFKTQGYIHADLEFDEVYNEDKGDHYQYICSFNASEGYEEWLAISPESVIEFLRDEKLNIILNGKNN